MQSVTGCYEGSRHGLDDLGLKGLMSKIWSYRHRSPWTRYPAQIEHGGQSTTTYVYIVETSCRSKMRREGLLSARYIRTSRFRQTAHVLVITKNTNLMP